MLHKIINFDSNECKIRANISKLAFFFAFLHIYYECTMRHCEVSSSRNRHCGLDPQSPKRIGAVSALGRWRTFLRHDGYCVE